VYTAGSAANLRQALNPEPAFMKKPDHFLLLLWLVSTGLVVFGFVISFDQGLIQSMLDTDRSRICFVVIGIYGVGLAHSLRRTLYMSRELNLMQATRDFLLARDGAALRLDRGSIRTPDGAALPTGFVSRYVADLIRAMQTVRPAGQPAEANADLLEAYASKVRATHEFGWFVIDVMLKVGFLGTLVGFILMLASISNQTVLDASMMQVVLKKMSLGMSTALNTTLASLVGGILLSVPYYLLDRSLDDLLEQTVQLTEVEILPRLGLRG
jgi:hypothetical protein